MAELSLGDLGGIANKPEAIKRLVEKLASRHGELSFCYEAGPCGYGIHRQITRLGQDCMVVAPSLVPTRPGDHVKTNRRGEFSQAASGGRAGRGLGSRGGARGDA